jgi:hypothetical protein
MDPLVWGSANVDIEVMKGKQLFLKYESNTT